MEFKIIYEKIFLDKVEEAFFITTRDTIGEAHEDSEILNEKWTREGMIKGGYYTKIKSIEREKENERN